MNITFVKTINNEPKRKQAVYKTDEPVTVTGDFGCTVTSQYFLVSAVVAFDHGGQETFIFASDEEGNPITWIELPGSRRGTMSHRQVLEEAGYTPINPLC